VNQDVGYSYKYVFSEIDRKMMKAKVIKASRSISDVLRMYCIVRSAIQEDGQSERMYRYS